MNHPKTINGINMGDFHIVNILTKLLIKNEGGVVGQVLMSGGEGDIVWGTIPNVYSGDLRVNGNLVCLSNIICDKEIEAPNITCNNIDFKTIQRTSVSSF